MSYTPIEIQKMKDGRKNAKKKKPIKRKNVYHNDPELINKFRIHHLETNLSRDEWIERENLVRSGKLKKMDI